LNYVPLFIVGEVGNGSKAEGGRELREGGISLSMMMGSGAPRMPYWGMVDIHGFEAD